MSVDMFLSSVEWIIGEKAINKLNKETGQWVVSDHLCISSLITLVFINLNVALEFT